MEMKTTINARAIAEKTFGDKRDKTGHLFMQTLDAIALQTSNEHIACVVYLWTVLEHSDLKPMDLIIKGTTMRAAYAAERAKQRKNEPYKDYLLRVSEDDELVYPAVLAKADYLRNTDNYTTDDVTMISESAFYSMTYRFLRLYHDGTW